MFELKVRIRDAMQHAINMLSEQQHLLLHFSAFSVEQIPLLTLKVQFLTDEDILLYIYSGGGGGGEAMQ